MFGLPAVDALQQRAASGSDCGSPRSSRRFGLLLVIFGVVRAGRASLVPFAVGGYIAAAYWFTSSTSFANPAVTIARTLSDTFAGIEPSSVPAFVVAQLVGGLAAIASLVPVSRPSRRRTWSCPTRQRGHDSGRPEPCSSSACTTPAVRRWPSAGSSTSPATAPSRWSGGSEPGTEVNPSRSRAMAEVGIDITGEYPKPLDRRGSSTRPTSSSRWAAATRARSSRASATRTGSSTTPLTSRSSGSERSVTTSSDESRRCLQASASRSA